MSNLCGFGWGGKQILDLTGLFYVEEFLSVFLPSFKNLLIFIKQLIAYHLILGGKVQKLIETQINLTQMNIEVNTQEDVKMNVVGPKFIENSTA